MAGWSLSEPPRDSLLRCTLLTLILAARASGLAVQIGTNLLLSSSCNHPPAKPGAFGM